MQIFHEKVRRLESFTVAQRRLFEVTEDSSKRSSHGLLITRAIGNNALVVAHNSRTMQGLVGHFANVRIDQTAGIHDKAVDEGCAQFDRALRRVAGLGPLRETHIWLGGLSLYDGDGDYILGGFSDRRYIQARIDVLGSLAEIHREWTEEAHEDVSVQLIPETGVLYVEPVRLPQHFSNRIAPFES